MPLAPPSAESSLEACLAAFRVCSDDSTMLHQGWLRHSQGETPTLSYLLHGSAHFDSKSGGGVFESRYGFISRKIKQVCHVQLLCDGPRSRSLWYVQPSFYYYTLRELRSAFRSQITQRKPCISAGHNSGPSTSTRSFMRNSSVRSKVQ